MKALQVRHEPQGGKRLWFTAPLESRARWPMQWGMLFVVVLLLACGLVGVARSSGIEITSWSFHVVGAADAPEAIELPIQLGDRLPHHAVSYELSTTLEVPPAWRERSITLSVPYLPARVSLRVAGEDRGEGATELVTRYRTRGAHAWTLKPDDSSRGPIPITLVVRHTYEQSGWLDVAPRISLGEAVDLNTRVVRFFDELFAPFAFGVMLAMGGVSLVLYVLDRNDTEYLALFGIVTAVTWYMLFQTGVTQLVGPELEVPLTGFMVVSSTSQLARMAHAQCGLPPPGWPLGALWLLNAVVDVTFHDPFTSTHIDGTVAIVLVTASVLYNVVVYYRRNLRSDAPAAMRTHIFALSLFAVCAGADSLWWTGHGAVVRGVHTGCLGLTLYAFVQFFVIARAQAHAQQRVATSQREILVLNDELNHQLEERSFALANVVAQLQPSASRPAEQKAGDVVDARYRVVRLIGKGAMGTTYEVRRIADERALAMKVLTMMVDARVLARFAREAYIAASLTHEALVSVVDVNIASSGFMYIVMELVTGGSLEDHRGRFGDVAWALPLMADVAEGLTALHAEGILHRDLKPANVLVAVQQGSSVVRAKIADFGISGGLDEDDAPQPSSRGRTNRALATRRLLARTSAAPLQGGPLTEEGELLGTPEYMAPEILSSDGPPGASSDVFGFGVVAYEALSGRSPFRSPPFVALMNGELPSEAVPLREVAPGVPEEAARVIERSIALDPALRPTAAEACDALRQLAMR